MAEVIHRRGPERAVGPAELSTLSSLDWFNNRCLLRPIDNIRTVEAKEDYHAMPDEQVVAA